MYIPRILVLEELISGLNWGKYQVIISSVKESPPVSEAIDQGCSILVLEIHLPEEFCSNIPSCNLSKPKDLV